MCFGPDPSLTDVITAVGTFVTAAVAVYVAFTWQENLRKGTRHEAAIKVLEEASLFRYHFYDARNPLYLAGEFPPEYHAEANRTAADEAAGWAFVFTNRWKPVGAQMLELAKLRARAQAALGSNVAQAIEDLARKGRQLQNYFAERVNQYRVGPAIVAQWPDQEWVERVRQSIEADPDPATRTDAYSLEFDEKYQQLEKAVRPFV
jgi:hypothetical protein